MPQQTLIWKLNHWNLEETPIRGKVRATVVNQNKQTHGAVLEPFVNLFQPKAHTLGFH